MHHMHDMQNNMPKKNEYVKLKKNCNTYQICKIICQLCTVWDSTNDMQNMHSSGIMTVVQEKGIYNVPGLYLYVLVY
jgi:hypothetical protein